MFFKRTPASLHIFHNYQLSKVVLGLARFFGLLMQNRISLMHQKQEVKKFAQGSAFISGLQN
jgi:hypothetical protein